MKILQFIHNLLVMKFQFNTASWGLTKLLWRYRDLTIFLSERTTYAQIALELGAIEINPKRAAASALVLTALLHEIGHWVDYQDRNGDFSDYHKPSMKIKFEKRAWRNAIKLSKEYKLPFDYKDAQYSLSTYNQAAKSAFIEKELKSS